MCTTTVASVQARLGSTRLPGKVLFHIKNRRVLQWVVDRTITSKRVDQTVGAIGNQPENRAITEYCNRKGIDYVIGSEENLISRHLTTVQETECDVLVRITADCPFVPPKEIDRLIEEHARNDARYTTNVVDEMPVGTAVDIINSDVLAELQDLGDMHPINRLRSNPEKWDVLFSPDPEWSKFSEAHTAVDTPADYWTLVDAINAVGDDPYDVTEWVADHLENNSE